MKKVLLIIVVLLFCGCSIKETDSSETDLAEPNESEVSLTEYTCIAEILSRQVGKTADGNKVIIFDVVPYYEDPYSEVNYIPEFKVEYDLYSEFKIGDTVKLTFSKSEDQVIVHEMIPDNTLYQTAHTIRDFIQIDPVKVEITFGYYDSLEVVTLTEKDEIEVLMNDLDSIIVYEEFTRELGTGVSHGSVTCVDSSGLSQVIEFGQFVEVDGQEYNYRWVLEAETLNQYLQKKFGFE